MAKIYVIGGANIDIFAKSKKKIILKDSNPSSISFSYGGVARNIVENLANLNLKPVFISAFSNDPFGKMMADDLRNKDVDLSYSVFTSDKNSSIYLALMDRNDMFVGASDMEILSLITKDKLQELQEVINDDDYLIFDTNLNEELIEYIACNLKGIKVVDAISKSKVLKIKKVLDKLSILKLNKLEAEKLLNRKITKQGLRKASKDIHKLGVKEVLISDSSDIYLTNDKSYHYKHFAYRDNPVNVTGAGDALLAGYVYGKFYKLSIDETVKLAISLAILTVDDNNPVAKINVDTISKFVKDTRIEKL